MTGGTGIQCLCSRRHSRACSGIQRNKGNHLDVPATHQRGVSGLCFTGADDESNTARSSGFPPNPIVPPKAGRWGSARMTARRAVSRQKERGRPRRPHAPAVILELARESSLYIFPSASKPDASAPSPFRPRAVILELARESRGTKATTLMFPLPINGGSVACALLVLMMKAILLVPLDSPRTQSSRQRRDDWVRRE